MLFGREYKGGFLPVYFLVSLFFQSPKKCIAISKKKEKVVLQIV